MDSAIVTNIGNVRDENQDKVELRNFGESELLAIVCDGMGGESSGEEASRLAIESFIEYFENNYKENMDAYTICCIMLDAVDAANSKIHELAKSDAKNFGMGTTCVAAYINKEGISIVNVGDSRAYYLCDGVMQQITEDHTFVNFLLKSEAISPEEAKTHPQRHMLIRAVGVEKKVQTDLFQLLYEPNFKLMLCSDGLCGFCSDDEIQGILEEEGTAQELAQKLLQLALDKGGKDNISIAVIKDF
ncbi:MAG: Stp1/IreP family PP2C-type Ser/Thr phosphatase [Ruminococcus sp.]|nr:Stp1/IreP family PP2C-type Ser/Thr phosphatase [Ruminococcus sp.]